MRVGLFVPCFVNAFYPEAAIATLRLLEHLGHEVVYPSEQTCCGQPQYNAGHHDEARRLAQRFCDMFDDFDAVVSPSGSCTAMVRNHYPHLVGRRRTSERAYEVCEFIAKVAKAGNLGARLHGKAALHVGCHEKRELGAERYVRQLLSHVEGLQIVSMESDSWCCGFGGTFAVKFPEISTAMGRRKLAPVVESNVDYLISTDASCLMHLDGLMGREKRRRPQTMHVAEVLASGLGEP